MSEIMWVQPAEAWGGGVGGVHTASLNQTTNNFEVSQTVTQYHVCWAAFVTEHYDTLRVCVCVCALHGMPQLIYVSERIWMCINRVCDNTAGSCGGCCQNGGVFPGQEEAVCLALHT